jgi:hypothetical protein
MHGIGPGLSSAAWRRLRAQVLARDGNRCRIKGVPAGSALGRPSIVLKRQAGGTSRPLEDLLPTGRRTFDSGGEALIQLCATTRLGTVSPGEATAPTRSST